MDAENVPRFRPFNRNWAALRIDVGHAQLLRGEVLLGLDGAAKGVLGLGDDGVTRLDGQDRLRIGAVDKVILALDRLVQQVGFPLASAGNRLAPHVALGQPTHRLWSSHLATANSVSCFSQFGFRSHADCMPLCAAL